MLKPFLKSAVLATALLMPASAMASVATPPVNHPGQWWTHPLGCEYSRAGRPGETIWFLIVNTRKKGCPTYFAAKTWGGVYRAQGPSS